MTMTNGPERYTRTNLPLSLEEAETRLEVLNHDVISIETRLELNEVESYANLEAYEVWRKKSISALSYIKNEMRIVKNWIKDQELRQVLETTDLTGLYIQHYSVEIPPENLEAASARRVYLSNLVQKIETGSSLIKPMKQICSGSSRELARAELELGLLRKRVSKELSLINSYLRENDNQRELYLVGFVAITRAVEEGFVLNDTEQQAYDVLKSKMKYT